MIITDGIGSSALVTDGLGGDGGGKKLVRQLVMNQIDIKFKTILISNGYNTNAGENVFQWHIGDMPQDRLPSINFRDISKETVQHIIAHIYRLTIEAELTTLDVSSDEEIRKLIQDVVNAIGDDPTWNQQAIDTEMLEDTILVDVANKVITGGIVRFVVMYREAEFNE